MSISTKVESMVQMPLLPPPDERQFEHLTISPDLGSAPPEHESLSFSLVEYYEARLLMIQLLAKTNQRNGFVAKNQRSAGLAESYEMYGSETPAVISGANRNASNVQAEIDKIFRAEELVAAGFAISAIERASRGVRREIEECFVGSDNANPRRKEYKRIEEVLRSIRDNGGRFVTPIEGE